ncbi:hypothetical protein AN644_02300 [Candidatus Epulonipiscium fishelsonii]|nr:hypothetical protein AN644_02300 [Epulopiscium sp. SCG-C06WGA-EpuloA1]
MKILAISGSGRKDRMTHNVIKELLKDCKDEVEIISLAGKKINGCIGCTACAGDNKCKVQDDWNEIGEKMEQADMIVFGAPDYFGSINALAHVCLERTYSFRHRSIFSLKDKLGVIVSTCETRDRKDPVGEFIKKMFDFNHIKTIGKVQVNQYSQCYTCGYGHDCEAGMVVYKHGILEEILPSHIPHEVNCQDETLKEIKAFRNVLIENGVKF